MDGYLHLSCVLNVFAACVLQSNRKFFRCFQCVVHARLRLHAELPALLAVCCLYGGLVTVRAVPRERLVAYFIFVQFLYDKNAPPVRRPAHHKRFPDFPRRFRRIVKFRSAENGYESDGHAYDEYEEYEHPNQLKENVAEHQRSFSHLHTLCRYDAVLLHETYAFHVVAIELSENYFVLRRVYCAHGRRAFVSKVHRYLFAYADYAAAVRHILVFIRRVTRRCLHHVYGARYLAGVAFSRRPRSLSSILVYRAESRYYHY